MAAQTHGYYGLGASSRTADFGLAASMTLPINTTLEDKQDPSNSTMPSEQTSTKKMTAKFAPEVEDHQDSVQQESRTKKTTWKKRLTGIFRSRSLKYESRKDRRDPLATGENLGLKKTVDDFEVDLRKAKKKRSKKSKRPNSTAFDEFTREGYLSGQSQGDLLKLALKPKGASNDFEAIKVTLHNRSDGFGIHLSGGLPPIFVTFVQPGSEAESARIMVGDIVTEVNGLSCLKEADISRVMGLKSLIQQSSIDAVEKRVDDTAWEKIKEKQVELESDNSEDGELTRIDGSSDSDNEQNAPLKDSPQKITKDTESPITSTPKKAKKKSEKKPSNKHGSQLSPAISENPEDIDTSASRQLSPSDSQSLVAVGVIKKKKRKKVTSTETVPATGSHKKKKAKSNGKAKKKKVSAASSGTPDNLQSSQDQGNSTKDQSSFSSFGFNLNSTSASEEHNDLKGVDSGGLENTLPASKESANADNTELLQPISNEKRSTSYHDLDKEDRKMFREELKQASKSEYDMKNVAQITDGPVVDIDPNVRVKKSGVVIGKRKTNERPSIFEADDGEKEDKEEKKERNKYHRKLVMDITEVPKTFPSLGLKHGHERLDVVTRSLSKRRPASLRSSLLLDTTKEILMGKAKVDLSEQGDVMPLRRGTMSEKTLSSRDTLNSDTTPKEAANTSTDKPTSRSQQSMADYMESLQRSRYSSFSGSLSSSESHRLHEEQTGQKQATDNHTKLSTNNKGKDSSNGSDIPSETKYKIPTIGGQRSNNVDQPVKIPGIASEPEWISIAQRKSNRTSVLCGDEKKPGKQSPPVTPKASSTPSLNGIPKNQTKDDSIPKMGTVRDRLAMFQKS